MRHVAASRIAGKPSLLVWAREEWGYGMEERYSWQRPAGSIQHSALLELGTTNTYPRRLDVRVGTSIIVTPAPVSSTHRPTQKAFSHSPSKFPTRDCPGMARRPIR